MTFDSGIKDANSIFMWLFQGNGRLYDSGIKTG